MVASDVGVTKGNRGSVIDLVAVGTPVVAVTRGENEIDDRITASLDGVVRVAAAEATPDVLASAIAKQANRALGAGVAFGSAAPICAMKISESLTE